MPKPTAAAPADKVALYEKLVATNPRVQRKGATMPYTSLNGNMFSLLDKDGVLILRLSDEQREAYEKAQGEESDQEVVRTARRRVTAR